MRGKSHDAECPNQVVQDAQEGETAKALNRCSVPKSPGTQGMDTPKNKNKEKKRKGNSAKNIKRFANYGLQMTSV